MLEMPFDVPAGLNSELVLTPSDFKQWNPWTTNIGFIFPAGSDLVLHSLRMYGLRFPERMVEALKSFWHLDEVRPYSINFLWGPLLTQNPFARAKMYNGYPPSAASATRVFYALIGLCLAGILLTSVSRSNARKDSWIGGLIVVFCVCWVLFDVRMGAEIVGYALHDYQTFISQEVPHRVLRTHDDIYDVVEQLKPYTQGQ